jgi:excisionase family DNA binding protein
VRRAGPVVSRRDRRAAGVRPLNDWALRISRHMTPEGSVVVPGRIAAWLEREAGLTDDRRILLRDADVLKYEVLAALHLAALCDRSGVGTKVAVARTDPRNLETWLTTAEAASRLGVTDRAIRKWIAIGRLPAVKHGGRWVLNRNHIQIAQVVT